MENRLEKIGYICGIDVYHDSLHESGNILIGRKSKSVLPEGLVYVDFSKFKDFKIEGSAIDKDEIDRQEKERWESLKWDDYLESIKFMVGLSSDIKDYEKYLNDIKKTFKQ